VNASAPDVGFDLPPGLASFVDRPFVLDRRDVAGIAIQEMTAFRTRRMILPLRVFGSMPTKFSSPITATGPSSWRMVSMSVLRSSSDGV
jgi:hypothetical protein